MQEDVLTPDGDSVVQTKKIPVIVSYDFKPGNNGWVGIYPLIKIGDDMFRGEGFITRHPEDVVVEPVSDGAVDTVVIRETNHWFDRIHKRKLVSRCRTPIGSSANN